MTDNPLDSSTHLCQVHTPLSCFLLMMEHDRGTSAHPFLPSQAWRLSIGLVNIFLKNVVQPETLLTQSFLLSPFSQVSGPPLGVKSLPSYCSFSFLSFTNVFPSKSLAHLILLLRKPKLTHLCVLLHRIFLKCPLNVDFFQGSTLYSLYFIL